MQQGILLTSSLAALLVGTVIGAFTPAANAVPVSDAVPTPQIARTPADDAIANLGVELTDHDIRATEAWHVGTDGIAEYWVGIQPDANVCLFGFIPGEHWVAASTCATPVDFYRTGLALRLGNTVATAPVESEAYLVPDEVAFEELPGVTSLTPQATAADLQVRLITVSDSSAITGRFEIERDTGIDFVFSQLPNIER